MDAPPPPCRASPRPTRLPHTRTACANLQGALLEHVSHSGHAFLPVQAPLVTLQPRLHAHAHRGVGGGAAAAAQAQHQVQGALLLDVVVGQGAAVLQLLAREDEALLVGRDACGGRQGSGIACAGNQLA